MSKFEYEIDNYNDVVRWNEGAYGGEYITVCSINEIDELIKTLQELKIKVDSGNFTRVEFS